MRLRKNLAGLFFSQHQPMKQSAKITVDSRNRAAYRLREVSEMTGIPASTLRTMVRRGDLNPITSFGVWLISAEEFQALLHKRLRNRG